MKKKKEKWFFVDGIPTYGMDVQIQAQRWGSKSVFNTPRELKAYFKDHGMELTYRYPEKGEERKP